MERTCVLNGSGEFGGGVLATREDARLSACRMPHGSSARDLLEAACGVLRAVSLEGLDEDGLCRVVTGAGQVKALVDALTVRAASGLEALRVGSAREALVAGAKLSGRAARRVTEVARQVEEMPNVGRLLDAGDLTLESVFALGAAARQCGAAVVDGSDELERLANIHQYVAVALRDRGCVLCRAPMHRCRLHHVDEFCADEGMTDIENLVALCNGCHLWVHRTNQRVVRKVDAYGIITWSTAPRGSDPGGREGRDPNAAGLADGFNGCGDHVPGDMPEARAEVGASFAGRDPPAAG